MIKQISVTYVYTLSACLDVPLTWLVEGAIIHADGHDGVVGDV